MKIKLAALTFSLVLISAATRAEKYVEPGVEYRTGAERFAHVWESFYVTGDHESELDDPLIAAGAGMVGPICAAIMHKDMKRRRYAIGALGFIADQSALTCLEKILKDQTEIDYFRGDALHSIYQIDKSRGENFATQHKSDNDYLKMLADAISKKAAWLTEPTRE